MKALFLCILGVYRKIVGKADTCLTHEFYLIGYREGVFGGKEFGGWERKKGSLIYRRN